MELNATHSKLMWPTVRKLIKSPGKGGGGGGGVCFYHSEGEWAGLAVFSFTFMMVEGECTDWSARATESILLMKPGESLTSQLIKGGGLNL